MCVEEQAIERPTMREVVQILTELPKPPSSKHGDSTMTDSPQSAATLDSPMASTKDQKDNQQPPLPQSPPPDLLSIWSALHCFNHHGNGEGIVCSLKSMNCVSNFPSCDIFLSCFNLLGKFALTRYQGLQDFVYSMMKWLGGIYIIFKLSLSQVKHVAAIVVKVQGKRRVTVL